MGIVTIWQAVLAALLVPLGNCRGMATLNVATKTTWDAIVPEYWDKTIMPEADRQSIGAKLAGPDGSDAPVYDTALALMDRG